MVKNHATNNEKEFVYEERHSIDKGFINEESSSSSLRSLKNRCFRKGNAFSCFRFEDKINNFWKHVQEEFTWDCCIQGAKVKSWSIFSIFVDIDFI